MLDESPSIEFEQIVLEKVKFGYKQVISQHLMDADISFKLDDLMQRFEFYITGYLWGDDQLSKTVKYPSDWWQAFKERWFPVWMLERWPVRYTIHEWNARIVYPQLRIQMPKETRKLVMNSFTYEHPPRN